MAINPERPGHPVFEGVERDRLFLWSDYSGWDQSKAGFPKVFPVTQGFAVVDKDSLGGIAVLANYDHGLEAVGLCEVFDGEGSVMVSGFDIVNRAGLDPVADKVLVNMINYMSSSEGHYAQPLIDSAILWGDYASERGLVAGIYNGLIINTTPIVPEGLKQKYPFRVDEKLGFQFAGKKGGWNSKPCVQYVSKGRRAFGPYKYTLGGRAVLTKDAQEKGTGIFWARIPVGKKAVLTKVENPSEVDGEIEVVVNGQKVTEATTIAAGKTEVLRSELPDDVTEVSVRYTGHRTLVLLETRFE